MLLSVIGHTSGQFVKPKKIAVNGPSKDFSVIELLFTSLSEKAEPLNDATRSSFWLFIDKKTGNIKNRKITRHPLIIEIEVFIFIVDI